MGRKDCGLLRSGELTGRHYTPALLRRRKSGGNRQSTVVMPCRMANFTSAGKPRSPSLRIMSSR